MKKIFTFIIVLLVAFAARVNAQVISDFGNAPMSSWAEWGEGELGIVTIDGDKALKMVKADTDSEWWNKVIAFEVDIPTTSGEEYVLTLQVKSDVDGVPVYAKFVNADWSVTLGEGWMSPKTTGGGNWDELSYTLTGTGNQIGTIMLGIGGDADAGKPVVGNYFVDDITFDTIVISDFENAPMSSWAEWGEGELGIVTIDGDKALKMVKADTDSEWWNKVVAFEVDIPTTSGEEYVLTLQVKSDVDGVPVYAKFVNADWSVTLGEGWMSPKTTGGGNWDELSYTLTGTGDQIGTIMLGIGGDADAGKPVAGDYYVDDIKFGRELIVLIDTVNNLALDKNTAVNSQCDDLIKENLTDGDFTTRWAPYCEPYDESIHENRGSAVIDLEGDYQVQRVLILWEAAFATDYTIQVSLDSTAWDVVHTEGDGDGLFDNVIFDAAPARYVRILSDSGGYVVDANTVWCPSIWEVEVFGNANDMFVNAAPIIDAIDNITITSLNTDETVNLSGIGDGDILHTQGLSIAVTSSADHIATAMANYTPGESTGTLTISAVANGTATITVLLKDDGGKNYFGVDSVRVSFTVTIDDNTGIDNPLSDQIRVYPIPADDLISIRTIHVIREVTITDMAGRTVRRVLINADGADMDISDLRNGIYFITIDTEEGVVSRKIVK
ncbi:MAG: discoidin domain-containing protein [Bacteroidota bacterium]